MCAIRVEEIRTAKVSDLDPKTMVYGLCALLEASGYTGAMSTAVVEALDGYLGQIVESDLDPRLFYLPFGTMIMLRPLDTDGSAILTVVKIASSNLRSLRRAAHL